MASTSSLPQVKVPSEAVSKIEDDLDTLEELLEPLLEKPFPEILEKLGTLQKAKLCTLLPYIVNSLMLSEYSP